LTPEELNDIFLALNDIFLAKHRDEIMAWQLEAENGN
jgi:hypothetical protein